MHETCCIGEDVVVYVGVFQGRVRIVVDSVDEEDETEDNREVDDAKGRVEEGRGRLWMRHLSGMAAGVS